MHAYTSALQIRCTGERGAARRTARLTSARATRPISQIMRTAHVVAAVSALLVLTSCGSAVRHSSSVTSEDHPSQQMLPSIPPLRALDLDFVRSNGVIESVQVDVKAPILNALVQMQVLRGPRRSKEAAVVFDRSNEMTDVAPPPSALSSWSGTLSPSDWIGGCEHDQYSVAIFVMHLDTKEPFLRSDAPSFWCR
jgi:hypothetical protein